MTALRIISTRMAGAVLVIAAVALLIGWLLGVILSDRWTWTQWLSWIPSLMLIPTGLAWLLGTAMLPALRRAWAVGAILILAGPMVFLVDNWRPHRPPLDPGPALTITQWTLGSVRVNEADYAEALINADADLSIIEGGRRVRWSPAVQDWLGENHPPLSTGIFSVLTRLPVERLRSAVWAEGIHMAVLEVHGPGFEEEPLRLLLVDLPSDPNRNRQDIARRFRALREKVDLDPVDLIMGDFNMTAGSAALDSICPGFTRAWPESGSGWAPTFPREWPVFRLDHVFVGPRVTVSTIQTIDPGVGRHRLQVMTVRPRQDSTATVMSGEGSDH
ncbi:MAG: endonuclease/exonuclease/phosphatase family protein [Phycisphaerales bacterium]|nr:endonuclease/exonuclease/phosphatase family protein [Phycisphaerales bacterium]